MSFNKTESMAQRSLSLIEEKLSVLSWLGITLAMGTLKVQKNKMMDKSEKMDS
jgi:hypothetical protein